ncbi:MAG TPA: hypothetical protein VLA39_02980, partial [Marinobacterium sp.]|nr:hypothetical protein [Marinobacterium sp.]
MNTKVNEVPGEQSFDPSREDRLKPYGGYHQNRVPAHDPELTEVGPGSTMGEYMRRFWQPV